MIIHHKGTSYFDSTAHLTYFVHSFERNDICLYNYSDMYLSFRL